MASRTHAFIGVLALAVMAGACNGNPNSPSGPGGANFEQGYQWPVNDMERRPTSNTKVMLYWVAPPPDSDVTACNGPCWSTDGITAFQYDIEVCFGESEHSAAHFWIGFSDSDPERPMKNTPTQMDNSVYKITLVRAEAGKCERIVRRTDGDVSRYEPLRIVAKWLVVEAEIAEPFENTVGSSAYLLDYR